MDKTEAQQGQGEQVQSAEELAREWTDLLTTLVPPSEVEVEDITGHKHMLRSALPAAVETRILRHLQAIKLPSLGDVPKRITEASQKNQSSDSIAALIDGFTKIAGDEHLLKTMCECFAMAHPRALRMAVEHVQADEDLRDYLPKTGQPTAADVFSTADLVAGLVPFALRAVSRIGTTAATLLPQKT